MTILSEVTQWPSFLFVSAMLLVSALFMWVITGAGVYEYAKHGEPGDMISTVAAGLVALLLSAGFVAISVVGPDVHAKAVVTDWNEVHAKGYEVVGQEGEIITLRKAQP